MIALASSPRSAGAAAALTPLVFALAATTTYSEPIIGQFELKTLESSPGAIELQSQNAWSWGHPARQLAPDDDGELVFDENAVVRQRHALEVELGITTRVKTRIGIEFEKERIDEPTTVSQADRFEALQLTELGLELIAIVVPREADGAGLGFVVEFERPAEDDEPDRLILGTIIEFQSDRWFAAAVPMVAHTLGGRTSEGEPVDDKWDFAYATQLAYGFSDRWRLALEAYGTLERLRDSGHRSEAARVFGDFDQHRAGAVLYYAHEIGAARNGSSRPPSLSSPLGDAAAATNDVGLTIGFGWLAGLNDDTPDGTLKLSIEVDF